VARRGKARAFATYAITDTLAGTGLADHLAGEGGQYFAIFADGHSRQLPRLTGGPFRYKTYAADTLAKSIGLTRTPSGPGSASTPAPAVTGTRCTAPTWTTTTCCRGMNAGYFLIQLASERDRDRVYKIIGEQIRDDADGVAQMAYVGVINPLNPRVESPEEVRDALIRAANFIPRERLGATDDCGFSPFSIDEKPNHGSPDYARDVAFQKIANRVAGTRLAAEKLGVG
jgi:hypothetical protein